MNKFYKFFIQNDEKSRVVINWFLNQFPSTEFKGVDKVLYFYLEFCDKLGISPSSEYLIPFTKSELRKLIVKYEIIPQNVSNIYSLNDLSSVEEAFRILSESFLNEYEIIDQAEHLSIEEFKVDISSFISEGIKKQSIEVFTGAHNKFIKHNDATDVALDAVDRMLALTNIYSVNCLDKLDTLLNRPIANGNKARLISKTALPCINADYGMYSKALITGAGQPGYGKTRFFLSTFIYPALMNGVSCRVDSLELADYEIKNILISIHLSKVYRVKIADSFINRGDLTEDQQRYVDIARMDLFESNKYGKLYVFTEDLYINTMYNVLTSFFRVNNDVQILLVDYIGLIRGNPKYNTKKAEIIDEALVTLKSVAKVKDVCVIGINQFNDDGNTAAENGVPIRVGMIQGGQAVQKHSDYDIAITATPQQKAAGIRMIETTKNRASLGFHNVPLDTDLGISRFTQKEIVERRS